MGFVSLCRWVADCRRTFDDWAMPNLRLGICQAQAPIPCRLVPPAQQNAACQLLAGRVRSTRKHDRYGYVLGVQRLDTRLGFKRTLRATPGLHVQFVFAELVVAFGLPDGHL